jgi:hypothetical protein
MRRKTFDALAVAIGLALAAVLLVAGGLLTWGHSFISDQVHTQLSAQKIYFPAKNSAEIKALPASDAAAMNQYAGQLMTTGAQAHTYANNFIAVHLSKVDNGLTYSQLSAASMAQPKNTVLAADVATVFKGTTLRSMLLNAYAFGTMGVIAGIAAIAAFVGAALMLILSGFGIYHLRRTSPRDEVLPKLAGKIPAHAAS